MHAWERAKHVHTHGSVVSRHHLLHTTHDHACANVHAQQIGDSDRLFQQQLPDHWGKLEREIRLEIMTPRTHTYTHTHTHTHTHAKHDNS